MKNKTGSKILVGKTYACPLHPCNSLLFLRDLCESERDDTVSDELFQGIRGVPRSKGNHCLSVLYETY